MEHQRHGTEDAAIVLHGDYIDKVGSCRMQRLVGPNVGLHQVLSCVKASAALALKVTRNADVASSSTPSIVKGTRPDLLVYIGDMVALVGEEKASRVPLASAVEDLVRKSAPFREYLGPNQLPYFLAYAATPDELQFHVVPRLSRNIVPVGEPIGLSSAAGRLLVLRAVVNALRIMRTARSGVPVAPSNELLLDMPNIREKSTVTRRVDHIEKVGFAHLWRLH